MAISINWGTKVIFVPQSYLTNLGGGVYEMDINQFRLDLKNLEDDENGMAFLRTHNHNTETTVGGVTLARVLEIINGYTITFEDGQYAVSLVGANSNISDVTNVNQVSLRSNNTAGMTVSTETINPINEIIESGLDMKSVLKVLLAVMAGRTDIIDLGGGNATVKFRNQDNTLDRVTASMSGSERTAVTIDGGD